MASQPNATIRGWRGAVALAALTTVAFTAGAATAQARDWFVHATQGDDAQAGTADAPLATIQAAADRAGAGDVIHLQPDGATFHQSVLLRETKNLTLEGHACTLDGAEPISPDAWRQVKDDLYRIKVEQPRYPWYMLITTHGVEVAQQGKADKPLDPAELRAGQCTVQQIPDDTKSIWLYYRGAPKDIRARSVLFSGVATRDANVGLIVRDLTATHFLNDGFNIHGKARRCRFERVRGVDNRDEGLSLHNQSEAVIVDSIFTGNDNGVADINESESRYEACVFSDNRSNAIVFSGGTHTLVGGEVRSSNVPGVTVRIHEGKRARTKEVIPVACVFERVTFRDPQNGGKLFIGAGAVVDLTDIQLDGVQLVSDPTAVVRQSTTTN